MLTKLRRFVRGNVWAPPPLHHRTVPDRRDTYCVNCGRGWRKRTGRERCPYCDAKVGNCDRAD